MAAVPLPPVPQAFPAFPLPRTNEDDFEHALQYVTNLVTPAQRTRVTEIAGVTTADDLLYIDEESLLTTVSSSMTIISKMRLKAMKRWAKEQDTLGNEINICNFTPEVFRKI